MVALGVGAGTSGCGGCPRTRGARAHTEHPAATDVIMEEPILVDAVPGPPLEVELDRAAVHAVVLSQTSDVRHCFETARAEHPALSGVVDLDLTIAPDGIVRGAAVAANDTGDGVLAVCLIALAEHWHFPSSPNGAHVRVPFEVADPPPEPQAGTIDASAVE